MDHQQFSGHGKWDATVSFITGALSAIGALKANLLQINWETWWIHLAAKSFEVGFVALVGGAMGLIGKKLVEKYLFKKPKV